MILHSIKLILMLSTKISPPMIRLSFLKVKHFFLKSSLCLTSVEPFNFFFFYFVKNYILLFYQIFSFPSLLIISFYKTYLIYNWYFIYHLFLHFYATC